MPALSTLAMLFQDTASLASDVHTLMIAEVVIAVCIVLVILAVLIAAIGAYVAVKNVQKKVDTVTKTMQARAMPLIGQGQDLLTKVQDIVGDLKPKIASVSGDVTHISGVVKEKVDEISVVISKVSGDVTDTVHKVSNQVGETVEKVSGQVGETVTQVNSTVQDVNGKTKKQVERVNGIVSEALNATEQVSRSIQHGIRVPVDKMASWLLAAKSGLEGIVAKTPFGHKPEPHRPASVTPIRTTTVAPGGPPFVPTPKDANRPM